MLTPKNYHLLLACLVLPGMSVAQEIEILSSFGQMEGSPEEVFGLIEDAVFWGTSYFVVLDSRMQHLRLLDRDGNSLASVGRGGRGPGEYFVPEALAVVPEGVAVLDRGNARITIYELDGGNPLQMSREIPLRFQAWDLCVADERIFLSSDGWETPILEIDAQGRIQHRFGESPSPAKLPTDAPEALRSSLEFKSRVGRLDCSAEGLTWASSMTGLVRHYSLDRSQLFAVDLPGFEAVLPHLTPRRTVRYGPRDGVTYIDAVEVVVHVEAHVVVQALRTDYGDGTRRVVTWIVDMRDGEAVFRDDIRVWIRDTDKDAVLLSQEDPYPQVMIGSWAMEAERLEQGRN